jgi:serine phosphatase RsbU (regulator of sigma subunit)/pSer/pThr/pTyr-binding forkhead associated (FHA) protein
MASLQVVKGHNEGTVIPLEGERDIFILGRNPDCFLHIPVTSVSREHAQIVRSQGKFYVEDRQSRNGTFVNNQQIAGRTLLKHNDKIRICDFVCAFIDKDSTKNIEPEPEEPSDDSTSTVEAALPRSHMLLETQPAEKLRGLLEISANLSKTLELDALLPKIADSMFQLFRQADRCFIIQADESGKLIPKVIKTRRPGDEADARFSRSIVRRCLQEAQAFLSDDASRDDRFQMAQSVVDFRIRSVMIVPLCGADGTAFGVIQLDTQDRSKKFNDDDLKLLFGVANQAAVALENAKLHATALIREKIKRDMELARQVQLSFLPSRVPEVPSYEFWAHYESALEVGGDYYGYIPLPNGSLALAMGDVAGKGVPAALLMAKLSSDTRFSVLTEPDPGQAVTKLNDLLCEFTSRMDRFVTFALAVLDPVGHAVTLVNAGHLSPLLYRPADGSLSDAMPNEIAGIPLGISDGFAFDSFKVSLRAGDSLVLFTDGVSESMSQANVPFGLNGIQTALKGAGAVSAKGLGERLIRAVHQHAAGRPAPHDDVTLLCFGRIS